MDALAAWLWERGYSQLTAYPHLRVITEFTKGRLNLLTAVTTPGQMSQQLRVTEDVVKIGRTSSAHVRLADPRANRMHAIIDATASNAVWLIDLGSSGGTFVNGTRITKARLDNGDRIVIGGTTIQVAIAPKP